MSNIRNIAREEDQPMNGTSSAEELLTELATAAWRVASRHNFQGAFIDTELDLWDALRPLLRAPAGSATGEREESFSPGARSGCGRSVTAIPAR